MEKGTIFWLLMILWFILTLPAAWPNDAAANSKWRYLGFGSSLLQFILLFLLGWQVFGFVVK